MDEINTKKLILRVSELEKRVKVLEDRTHNLLWSKDGDRETEFVVMYGEYVDKSIAARILGVTRATVYAMLADGRIKAGHNGRFVDVRSIAQHMQNPGCASRRGRKKKEE